MSVYTYISKLQFKRRRKKTQLIEVDKNSVIKMAEFVYIF
jgi:hypothetical protein